MGRISNDAIGDCQPGECQERNHTFNVSKAKKTDGAFSRKQQMNYSGYREAMWRGLVVLPHDHPGEESLTASLRLLKDLELPLRVPGTLNTCTINGILTGSITTWIEPSTKYY